MFHLVQQFADFKNEIEKLKREIKSLNRQNNFLLERIGQYQDRVIELCEDGRLLLESLGEATDELEYANCEVEEWICLARKMIQSLIAAPTAGENSISRADVNAAMNAFTADKETPCQE